MSFVRKKMINEKSCHRTEGLSPLLMDERIICDFSQNHYRTIFVYQKKCFFAQKLHFFLHFKHTWMQLKRDIINFFVKQYFIGINKLWKNVTNLYCNYARRQFGNLTVPHIVNEIIPSARTEKALNDFIFGWFDVLCDVW